MSNRIIRLNESGLRKVVGKLLNEYGDVMYQVGWDDALAGEPPGDEDPHYMLGYNDAMDEQGAQRTSPPPVGTSVHTDWRKSVLGHDEMTTQGYPPEFIRVVKMYKRRHLTQPSRQVLDDAYMYISDTLGVPKSAARDIYNSIE